ncbi:MAG: VWA domain-containing protein, partial [Planctomycetota bacterium]|nr:VWA domain-containing protein [Planctomycetota bacterium]
LTKTFTAGNDHPNSVHVFATQTDEPFLFGKVMGHKTFGASASAISTSADSSLDIMLTLDLSGSMLYQGRIQALRQAAPVFVDVIDELGSTDKIGMMGLSADPSSFDYEEVGGNAELYNSGLHPTAGHHVGVLEQRLTLDFNLLKNTALSATSLRAGKYNGWTGTGAALGDSVHYLLNGAEIRSGAKRIVVLMSDGHANRPAGDGPGYAMQMATYAAANNVTVYTISLGNSTDQELMQNIADTTGGMHFLANGSGAVVLTQTLTAAFKDIAGAIKNTHLVK